MDSSSQSAHSGALILCALFSLVCATPANAATDGPQKQLANIDFRAAGHDPRWQFEVYRQGEVRFHVDGTEAIVHGSATSRSLGMGSSGVIYGAHTETHEVLAEILKITCLDPISSERFTHTVTIRLDGVEYLGCGEALTQQNR